MIISAGSMVEESGVAVGMCKGFGCASDLLAVTTVSHAKGR